MRYNRNERDAATALNTCFIKIIDHIESKKNEVDFDHWSKRIMINHLIDEFRKTKRRRDIQVAIDPADLQMHSTDFDQNLGEESLRAESILKLIQQLDEPGRTIFNMHAIEGYSHDEIAKALGIRTENSRYHLHAARKRLQAQIEKKENHTKSV